MPNKFKDIMVFLILNSNIVVTKTRQTFAEFTEYLTVCCHTVRRGHLLENAGQIFSCLKSGGNRNFCDFAEFAKCVKRSCGFRYVILAAFLKRSSAVEAEFVLIVAVISSQFVTSS